MKAPYHSALHPALDVQGELDYYEASGSVVFCHDLTRGVQPLYQRADAIYSEPAWKDGYALFMARAGADTDASYAGYLRYLAAIDSAVKKLKVPSYITLGKHMLKYLKPERVQPIRLHGYEALLGAWNVDELPELKTNEDAIAHVAERYGCVLDFSCGYGNLARAMWTRGKRFVCSDINARCVYYVAKTVMGYEG